MSRRRDQERANAAQRVWQQFRLRLAAVKTFAEAQSLAADFLPSGAPGGHYFTNLNFFLIGFIVPLGTSYEEKQLYIELIKRLDAAGQLNPGVGQRVEGELLQAMEAQGRMGNELK